MTDRGTFYETININIIRFLTFVRNDIFPYYDTVSKTGMTKAGVFCRFAYSSDMNKDRFDVVIFCNI